MPILDLNLWKISPNMSTCLKTLAVMIYPNQPDLRTDFEANYHQHASRFGRAHVDKWPIQKFLRMKLSLPIGPHYSQDGLYSTFIEKVSAGQKAGWMLWTAKRLYDADYHVDNVNRAADLLKKRWEAQNPGEAITQETLLRIWQDFEPVAHLWAAYWLYGDHSTDEFRHNGRFDLAILEDDFPAFLAHAESFRNFGGQQRILSPKETWSVPKDFSLPDVAIDSPPLTDEENAYLAEYRRLTEDYSVISDNEAQVENNDKKNVFRKDGDYWTITYEGQTIHLKHLKGLQHIAYLLKYAREEVSSTQLSVEFSNSSTNPVGKIYRDIRKEELAEEHLRISDLGDAGEILDDQAKREYQNRLRDLQEDLEEAEENNDLGQIEMLQQEMDALETELSRAVGLSGQNRAAASSADRARINVQKQIKAAIEKIAQRHSTLAKHLTLTIKTGHRCSYNPDPNSPSLWTF